MYVCVYVCVCTHTHIYIYIYLYNVYTHTRKYMYVYNHIYIRWSSVNEISVRNYTAMILISFVIFVLNKFVLKCLISILNHFLMIFFKTDVNIVHYYKALCTVELQNMLILCSISVYNDFS